MDSVRQSYRKRELSEEKIDKLKSVGFSWNAQKEKNEQVWQTKFNELVAYKEKNGDCKVVYRTQGQLGEWVSTQRKNYKKRNLSQERIRQLDDIGFAWEGHVGRNRYTC